MHLFSIRRISVCFLATLILVVSAIAQPINPPSVDAVVQEALKAWNVPGAAVAIIRGNEVLYVKGYGVKDLRTAQPITTDTIFAIGSTSKAFTTTAMAMLVDEGKMNWDDPVRKHIPWFRLSDPLANENVTMRDIVSHRTGLSRNDLLWYGSPWGREEIIRKIGFVKLTRPYRAVYQYQNIMFLTAGYAVGQITNSSWEDFVQRRIFDPLGMKTANFSATVAEKAADHATPHRKTKDDKIEPIPWRNIDNVGPAGSINASVRDLSSWVRMQLGKGIFEGKRIVSEKNLAETHTPQMVIQMDEATRANNPETNLMSYGLAWTVQDYRGQLMVSHNGAIDGFRARVALLPKQNLGIVLLINADIYPMLYTTANGLTDLMLGAEKKNWVAYYKDVDQKTTAEAKRMLAEREAKRFKDTKPSRDLAAYVGTYEDPGYGTATITLENGALALAWSNFKVKLEHFHFDTFLVRENRLENEQISFTLGADGEVRTMKLLDVEFKKVMPAAKATASR